MAVAFGAIGAKSAGGTTTVSVAHPASVGAGDLLIAGRCLYQVAGIAATDESGWTAGGKLRGGTGTSADNHATMAAADYKEAAGGETGSVTFDQGGTVAGALGVMARYTKGAGVWDVAAATGDDATHAADRSVTSSTTLALAPGDVIVAVVAVDTDAALTITSPTFTASGITFGTVNRRTSGAGVITGNDGNIEVFDVAVSTGTATVAVTLAFTTATTQCGPVSFLRLREAAAPANVTPVDSAHAHTADSPAVTQVHVTAPVDSAHAHAAESPAVTQVHQIAPADSLHGHSADSPSVSVVHVVAPVDSALGHGADSPAVTQTHVLAPVDSGLTHTADAPAVTQAHAVVPDDSAHGHAADSPTITGTHSVTPDDSIHDHAADIPAMTQAHDVAPIDSSHDHTAQSPDVSSGAQTIAPDNSNHIHAAESPTLTQIHQADPGDSLNEHQSDSPMLTMMGALSPTPAERTFTIAAENRTVAVPAEVRNRTIPTEARLVSI